jgi:PAS domain S-box-containing protein
MILGQMARSLLFPNNAFPAHLLISRQEAAEPESGRDFFWGGNLMNKRVLVVDNDPFMLEFYRDVLPGDRYELFTAEDGLFALDLLDTVTPDIIFVDLLIPNIHGKKLCKIIRGMERLKGTYLVILSATAAEERIDVEALGVNACIAKGPIEHMARRVREVLEHPDAAALRCSAGEVIGAEKSIPRMITHELLNAGKHYEAIMEVMNEGIVEIVSTGRIIYVNPAGLSLFGAHESRVLGTNFFELFSETDKPNVMVTCRNPGESEPGNRKCQVHIRGRKVMLKTLPLKTPESFTWIIILDDVTEKRQAETQRIQSKKREALNTFAGGIAHNFNNLLMAIQGNISLLMLKEGFNNGDSDRLKTIEEYVKSGSKLTAQLIEIGRGRDCEIKPTDLNKIIEKSAGMFGRTNKDVLIHQKSQKGIWIVKVDQGQLEQVFFNLYINARQAMPGGGELFLETQNVTFDENFAYSLGMNGHSFVKVSVRDTGQGMDKKTQGRIFDPFFSTKKGGMGTGLGLSTVYSTIREHNGMITVESEVGNGTVFNIFFPASAGRIPMEERSSKTMATGKGAILFVEDEKLISDTGKEMLEEMGYFCLTALDGRSALEIYEEKRHQIDMVILDMAMPDMGGGETFDRLIEVNPQIKVLISSGCGLDGEVSEVLKRGCSAFIQKPFNMNELSQKIRDVMSLN